MVRNGIFGVPGMLPIAVVSCDMNSMISLINVDRTPGLPSTDQLHRRFLSQ